MSYKAVLKDKLDVTSSDRVDDEFIITNLKMVYTKALDESKKTGESIPSITYMVLEAIEESYHDKSVEVEDKLIEASSVIVELMYADAKKSIKESKKRLILAQNAYIDTIDREILHLYESIETLEAYANDQAHIAFGETVSDMKSDTIKKVDGFKKLLLRFNPNYAIDIDI